MKRQDGVVVPDNYDRYEALKKERTLGERLDQIESRIQALELQQVRYGGVPE